jgi:tetratricopeptide (TPR) repeat protein
LIRLEPQSTDLLSDRVKSVLALFHAVRGKYHAAKGDLDRAIADYDQALKLNPNLSDARLLRDRAEAARAARTGADMPQPVR